MTKEMTMTPYRTREDIEREADQIRRMHGLTSVPIDPVALANRLGIKVNNAQFSSEGISGMIARRGEVTTLLINHAEPPYRKRFTIAHELGHHFLHMKGNEEDIVDNRVDLFRTGSDEEGVATDERRREVQANQFAAALLMPGEMVRSLYLQMPDVNDLARAFNVSVEAMGYRLSQLGLS